MTARPAKAEQKETQMKTGNNTRNARILAGTRFEGDDTFWIVENNCEDLGPFDSRQIAEDFYAEFVGPTGAGETLKINDDYNARKIVNFRDGEPDLGYDSADDYVSATEDATGLYASVIREYLSAGYYVAIGG